MNQKEQQKPWGDGEDYNRYILSELSSFRKDAWKKQIGQHIESIGKMRILDVGTGPGFFACILSEEGHEVVGIDYSDRMLECAKNNANKLGVFADFRKMNINSLEFKEEEFDVIVTRNVTWTLENPVKVYEELKRILKKGGVLLIYDANWHLHFFNEERYQRVRRREEEHFKNYGTREIVAVYHEEFFEHAPLTRCDRPLWDQEVLHKLNMEVKITPDISENVYEAWEKALYSESPLFEICAKK